jgi:hypothetical protein
MAKDPQNPGDVTVCLILSHQGSSGPTPSAVQAPVDRRFRSTRPSCFSTRAVGDLKTPERDKATAVAPAASGEGPLAVPAEEARQLLSRPRKLKDARL